MEENNLAVLIKVINKQDNEELSDISLNELELLCYTDDIEVFCRFIQKKDYIDSSTYLGSGKLEELKELCINYGINIIVADDELSPIQIKEISDYIDDIKVIDRSMLILDIFAKNATTNEGKLQIELAQLQYTVPRLYGQGKNLSRLGGGIGTRGPGETKLETDKRHVKRRINALREKIVEIEKNRTIQRTQRKKNDSYEIALVGYTNAGKSTLMNALTGANVLIEDKLFATLETTTRKYKLNNGESVLITDTVGFIRNLPHQFIDAFKSTLEELKYADLILIIIDVSDPEYLSQIEVTENLINDLANGDIPVVYVYNKIDKLEENEIISLKKSNNCVLISACTNQGIDELNDIIIKFKNMKKMHIKYKIPFSKSKILDLLYKNSIVEKVDYNDDCIAVEVVISEEERNKIDKLL